ncbi:ABC-F family ATP-binding cassette domain-containing protein [Nocardioides sp. KC13]|uniref:ABC-F family ATP-binding cassette domain-containing protein n=1 Tax=Nocardioides turkmenicus TaxID=2711220 RepID=A0A6M1R3S0_9ACTN|nr:ATP-binding cassette domain-containing protein [Nocardioides sp. KC13]NGN91157.1 ABC-F family ATP-binding cassette domain-containing protein [Nocardioides sp. KC13]
MFPSASTPSTSVRSHRVCELRSATVRFAERIVLDRVDLVVGPADRLAVVGDNGAGKSTLLDLLAGVVSPVAGETRVVVPGGIAHASQEPRFPDGATVRDAVDLLLADLRALESRIRSCTERLSLAGEDQQPALLEELGDLVDAYEARDGYGVDRRVDVGLDQLGLGGLDRGRPVDGLSGGERARLALAVALAANAELLLLDEPTNDLDSAALAWLEDRLAAHRGAMVVVTHDRAFLERFADDIVQVRDGGLRRYGNGYAGFLTARATERRRQAERHERWKAELARNEALVAANAFRLEAIPRKLELDGFGHGAFRARSRDHGAMGRIRMAKERVARLRAEPVAPPPEPLRFDAGLGGAVATGGDEPLVALHDVRREAGARLRMAEWVLSAGDRWLVVGPNGAGKTTLLRLLAGEIAPDSGDVERAPGARVSWLRQDVAAAAAGSVVGVFARTVGIHRDDAVERLRRFGLLREEDLRRQVRALSVGQRRRLDLAIALADPGDVLLLDEPTNHLDPELVEQLEDAIEAHPGAVVTVTHDRHWIRRASASRRVRVCGGTAAVVTA